MMGLISMLEVVTSGWAPEKGYKRRRDIDEIETPEVLKYTLTGISSPTFKFPRVGKRDTLA